MESPLNNTRAAVFGAIIVSIVSIAPSANAAKFAGEAFALGVGARSLALGGATVAGPFDGTAIYWNPAGLGRLNSRTIAAMHSETFGSLLNHDFVAYTIPAPESLSLIQSYGFSFYYLGGGGIKITDLPPNATRPIVVREEAHGDYAFSAGVAGKSRGIEFGASVRVFYRDLGSSTGYGGSLDLGALYDVDPNLTLGLTVTDLTSGVIRLSNGVTESITPTVRPAFMYKRAYGEFIFRALGTGDIRFEGRKASAQYYISDVSLDTHYGFEVSFREKAFGRVGADIGDLTMGAGFVAGRISVDVAFLKHSDLDDSYRFSAGYSF